MGLHDFRAIRADDRRSAHKLARRCTADVLRNLRRLEERPDRQHDPPDLLRLRINADDRAGRASELEDDVGVGTSRVSTKRSP